jgi:hypothetical protein
VRECFVLRKLNKFSGKFSYTCYYNVVPGDVLLEHNELYFVVSVIKKSMFSVKIEYVACDLESLGTIHSNSLDAMARKWSV